MANKKPLVIDGGGRTSEIASADTLDVSAISSKTLISIIPTSGTGSISLASDTSATLLGVTMIDATSVATQGAYIRASTDTAAAGPGFNIQRSRNTAASPNAVQSGDLLGFLGFGGWDTAGWNGGTSITSTAKVNWTSSNRYSDIRFSTRPSASTTSTLLMTLFHDGTNTLLTLPVAGGTKMALSGALSFTDSTGATTYGSLNLATAASASTDLVRLSDLSATNITATKGGTGFSTYTTGDLIYASASNTLSKLGIGTNGYVMTVVSGVPAWAAAAAGGDVISPFLLMGA